MAPASAANLFLMLCATNRAHRSEEHRVRPIQRIISAGFAITALASASLPALSWNTWSGSDMPIHVAALDAVLPQPDSNRR
jgi:hypothetical protein